MTSRFLEAYRHALRQKTTLAEAEQALGLGERRLSRRLAGKRPFPVTEMLEVAERFELDLHDILLDSGRLPEGLPELGRVMRILSRSHPGDPKVTALVDRLLSKVAEGRTPEPFPPNGLSVAPSDRFHDLESLRRRSRTAFEEKVGLYRRSVFRILQKRRKYSPTDVRDLAEVLDLSAKAVNVDVPYAMATLGQAFRLPLDGHSLSRLYLEDHAGYLLRQEGEPDLSVIYQEATLSRALIVHSELAARICLGLSVTHRHLKRPDLARRCLLTTMQLAPDSPFGYQAAFNLANAEVTAGRFDEALKYLDDIEEHSFDDPQLTFRALWLSAKVRAKKDQRVHSALLFSRALAYRPEEQNPVNLLYLIDEIIEAGVFSPSQLASEIRRVLPYCRKINSRAARDLLDRLMSQLAAGREPTTIRPALDRLRL